LSAKYFLAGMRREKWGRFVGRSSHMVELAITGMSHYIALGDKSFKVKIRAEC
jgi:hypothetical protein